MTAQPNPVTTEIIRNAYNAIADDMSAAIARSAEIVAAGADLDQRCVRAATAPVRMSLRWVLVHMVEETGRHAGHADILREQLDGQVGR